MALPFLPHEWIPLVFNQMKTKNEQQPLDALYNYIDRYWMGGMFKPEQWTVYQRRIRTNNDAEGYHNKLNSKAKNAGLNLYKLIALLHEEAVDVEYTCRFVREGLVQRRERGQELNDKIMDAWTRFKEGDLSAKQLLQECSKLNGPPAHLLQQQDD